MVDRIGLVTGITGQDGSYLAELLLDKGYIVYGTIRRASSFNTGRIEHIRNNPNLILKYGDMTDSINLCDILLEIKNKDPKRIEIYNLAAMSHVKVSFEVPEYTVQVGGVGVLRLLEAIRITGISDITRFYQASTSELYGKVQQVPQDEKTPFYPRSPYGVAKLYGYWITKNYREAYNMFACNGILFNHESVAGSTPLIFRQNGMVDIKPISEIVKDHTVEDGILINENKKIYQEGKVTTNLEVWDNNRWTKVKFASAYPHDKENNNKNPRFIISDRSAYLTTGDHVIIMDDGTEIKAKDIKIGDNVSTVDYPDTPQYAIGTKNGCYNTGIEARKSGTISEYILNATKYAMEQFIDGFLGIYQKERSNPNKYDNIYVNSESTAQKISYIINKITGIQPTIDISTEDNRFIYIINGNRENKHNNKVKKIIECRDYNGWFYDLETESGTFSAGIGTGRVHNSPRRGPTFVTRKITRALGNIIKGEQDKLILGNIDAKRDWGHAKDYVYAMYLILQHDTPEDYVISMNEYHSVREFVEKSFKLKNFDIEWRGEGVNEKGYDKNTNRCLIEISQKYFRPTEVEELLGDSTKARETLNWTPEYTFDKLVEEMVEHDCE